MVLPKKKLTKFVFVNFYSILYHYSTKSIKMNNYQDLYSVYGEYNNKFYLETYSNHKDAYSRYAELSFKMLKQAKKEWKKNPNLIPQFYETSSNGYNRSTHCRIGHIYVDRIPDVDEID